MLHIYKKILSLKRTKNIILFIFIFSFFSEFSQIAQAGLIEEIQSRILNTQEQKKALEDEIIQTEAKLQVTTGEKQTLQKDLTALNLAKKRLDVNIKKTEGGIVETSSTILKLQTETEKKIDEINQNKRTVREILSDIHSSNSESIIIRVLGGDKLSDYLETSQNLNGALLAKIDNLNNLKTQLENKRATMEGKKKELSSLVGNLSGQKQSVIQTEATKDNLLKQTRNQELAYQKTLQEKRLMKEQFEKELFSYESELAVAIDPSKLPTARKGIISWPLDKFVITQLFGVTSASARLYKSGTHNGVDFGVPDGTPVKAVLNGVVAGTGNTDVVKRCLSYGKWVAITHANGLTSVYGHMSGTSVVAGQAVTTGQIVGYSGRTGYATGPHLHLSIMASEAVKIGVIPSNKTVACRGVTIPLALGTDAFLDPMIYLPPKQ